ncbi:hypothetical protein D3C73_1079720 [compost metagenome]
MIFRINSISCSLYTNQLYIRFIQKGAKHAYCIASPANTSYYTIWKTSFRLYNLFSRLLANDGLKILNNGWKRVRTYSRTKQIMCVANIRDPIANRFIDSILKRLLSQMHQTQISPQQLHALHVWQLTLSVNRPHVHDAFQTKQTARRSNRYAMLASSGFCHDSLFAHSLGQQRLSERVIYFVCTCMR